MGGGYVYASGTTATLSATPWIASVFNGWISGCTPNYTNPLQCSVVMDGNKTVIAAFGTSSLSNVTLTATTTGNGLGIITNGTTILTNGPVSYPNNGMTLVLMASPSSATSTFTGWTGCTASLNNPLQCTVAMDANKTVSANFIPINPGDTDFQNLGISTTGVGTVSITDLGDVTGSSITYASGTTVTLTATVGASSVFAWWTGCTSNTNQCTVTMNSDKNVVAHFVNSTTGTLPTTSSTYKRTFSSSGIYICNDVKALQKFLVSKGFNVKVTSLFDKGTKNALIQYQQSRGITPADGKFSPATRAIVIAETNSPVVNPITPTTNPSTDPNVISDKTCYKIPWFTNPHKLIEMSCTSSEYLKLNKVFRLEVLKTSYVLTPTVTTVSPATGRIDGLLPRYVKGMTATLTALTEIG